MTCPQTPFSLFLSSLLFATVVGCTGDETPPRTSDTKTNWMVACDGDAECGSELACICGICTQTCDADAECNVLSSGNVCKSGDACSSGAMICEPNPQTSSGGGGNGAGGSERSSGGGGSNSGGNSPDGGASADGGMGGSDPGAGGLGPSSGGAMAGGGTNGSGGASAECGCITDSVSWNLEGGRAVYLETHELKECYSFTYVASPISTEPPTRTCTRAIDSCDGPIGPAEVQASIEHVDVQAALAAAPILYGLDPRPVDGQVFTFQVAGAVVQVGEPCADCTDILPIPEGVSALVELLETLADEQLAQPPCDEINLP